MDFLIICSILIVTILIIFIVIRRKDTPDNDKDDTLRTESMDNEQINALKEENDALKSQLELLDEQLRQLKSDSSEIEKTIKSEYENLLREANDKCVHLDKQLESALQGKVVGSLKDQLADTQKLEKKIKDLEEEIEENEEDISALKKKIRIKDDYLAKQQDELSKEQKKSQQLNEEILSVRQTLEEKVRELKLKMESLDFIQEILSAPDTNRSDVKQLDNNIAGMKSFALSQLMDCFATLKDHINFGDGNFREYKKHWQHRFYEWASVTKKSWINGKTTIAFVGEFSAGKTSIVNRILSQDNPNVPQLPVSTKATTAVATYIAGGPVVSYQFVTPDDKLKTISEKTFTEKVSKEVLDQVKGVSSLIQYFVMTYKNPNLNGLSILDTPGFNSNDKKDAERTMEVINECDALFWVFDVNNGTINRSSITVIKDNLTKPLFVVINKVDTKAESEIKKVEDLIRATLANEGINVEKYIRFSSKAPLSDIMNPIKSVKHSAEKEQYISDLRETIDTILTILNDKVRDCDKTYRKAVSKGQDMDEDFVQQIKSLYFHCSAAAEIPHFEEHLFRADGYEMSQEEYSTLCNILENSVSEVERVSGLYDNKTDVALEIQQNWGELCEAKMAWQRVNDIKSQFNKISKRFQL